MNIISSEKISAYFKNQHCNTFADAQQLVRALPYARNSNKHDDMIVCKEAQGTCSTKHVLLKQLANENNWYDVQLMLGIFMMDKNNTPSIAKVLQQYNLSAIPEAHNYLRQNNTIIDCTKIGWTADHFLSDLVVETEIKNLQDWSDHKIEFHQTFIKQWMMQQSITQYNFQDIWQIRELCIAAISV
jgi:hypothetical protein